VGEILSLVGREWVLTLSDLVHRRTKMAFRGEITPELVEELADILSPVLGWSPTERSQQISSLVIQENHRES
jgi:glycerol-3-phosphate dehydrogenase